jgi:hypothetical protein
MGKRDICFDCSERTAQGARSIALDNEKVRRVGQQWSDSRGDGTGMGMWILLPAAIEPGRNEAAQAMVAQHEPGVLASQDQRRRSGSRGQGVRNRRELDRFGAGADDEGNARAGQLRVSNSSNPAPPVCRASWRKASWRDARKPL